MKKLINDPMVALGYGYQHLCLKQSETDEGCLDCPFGKLITQDMSGMAAYSCTFGFLQSQLTDEQLTKFNEGIDLAKHE